MLFVIFLTTWLQSPRQTAATNIIRNPCNFHTVFYHVASNYVIHSNRLKEINNITSNNQCFRSCLENIDCSSVAVYRHSNQKLTCELYKNDLTTGLLKKRTGWEYYDTGATKRPLGPYCASLSSNPCPSGCVCRDACPAKTFTCDCNAKAVMIGCCRDDISDRVFTTMVKNLRSKIDWYDLRGVIRLCRDAARAKGFHYFAIQNYGECFAGNNLEKLYCRHGEMQCTGKKGCCASGVGEDLVNAVYKFI